MTLQMYKIVADCRSADGNSWIRRLVALLMNFVLICDPAAVSAYNIDTNYRIVYPDASTNLGHTPRFARGYFGYSVLLHHDSQRNASWLYVGAPRGNYTVSTRKELRYANEPGVIYLCNLLGLCKEIEMNGKEYGYNRITRPRIIKDGSWFGGAMSIDRSIGLLTVCAPRTLIIVKLENGENYHSLQGMCYNNQILSQMMQMDDTYVEKYDFSQSGWDNPLQGFSITYAPSQGRNDINRIIGAPNQDVSGAVIMSRFLKQTRETTSLSRETYRRTIDTRWDDISQFGYSTTAGYYFNRTRLLYAAGDPTWKYVGQVAVLKPDEKPLVMHLEGSEIGEYFGASLATGDLNQDGLDDLIVGAPHWKNDNGRVHIYLGTSKENFDTSVILEGANEDALFGYAIACGDLDGDGYSDIIVGAPWEESGAIYIYNGDASLKDKVKPIASQRITMQLPSYSRPTKLDIQTFGFSIAEPIDIDANGYVDIAVGAYKSGHAVVLRSRPVVKTSLTVHTVPATLQRNVSNFLVQVCVEYRGYDAAREHAFKISLTIDEEYKRTKGNLLNLISANTLRDKCVNTSVTLSKPIQNFIEPITIYAQHEFTHKDLPNHDFCQTCPVERKNDMSEGVQTLLSFDIGCGADKICNSNISAIVKFSRVRNNNSWVIGSNDITLEATLMNHAEPSYLTTIAFILPHGIVPRKISTSCQEDAVEGSLTITCNAGNPLENIEPKIVKLDLDMRRITDGSLHGQALEFTAEIGTHSVNHGIRTIKSSLTLQSEAFLSVNGKANEESYYLPDLDNKQLNVSFQHTYQIQKSGATPIKEARLFVNIPTSVNDSSSFIFLHKPRIYIAGEYSDCLSNGIDVIDTQQNDLQDETVSDVSILNTSAFNNESQQNVSHGLLKRDISSHTTMTAAVVQPLYSATMITSVNSTGSLTQQDIVYLNCSSPNVNCSMVSCDLSALKTQQDIGKLEMRLIINVTKLKDAVGLTGGKKIVKFSTEAHVEIIQPANRITSVEDTRCDVNITTEFHSIAMAQKLQLWVVLVSVLLGLILLCIVVILLYMTGFFRRTMKEELAALKKNEMTEDVNRMIEDDVVEDEIVDTWQ